MSVSSRLPCVAEQRETGECGLMRWLVRVGYGEGEFAAATGQGLKRRATGDKRHSTGQGPRRGARATLRPPESPASASLSLLRLAGGSPIAEVSGAAILLDRMHLAAPPGLANPFVQRACRRSLRSCVCGGVGGGNDGLVQVGRWRR